MRLKNLLKEILLNEDEKKPKYTANDIAVYLINRSIFFNRQITNKQLNNMLYYIQIASIIYLGHPMFKDKMKHFILGAAVPSIYNIYKYFENKPIRYCPDEEEEIDKESKNIINIILDVKSKYSQEDLMKKVKEEKFEAISSLFTGDFVEDTCTEVSYMSGEIDFNIIKEYYLNNINKIWE